MSPMTAVTIPALPYLVDVLFLLSLTKSPTFTYHLQLIFRMTILSAVKKENSKTLPAPEPTTILDDDSLFCGEARSIDHVAYQITDLHLEPLSYQTE